MDFSDIWAGENTHLGIIIYDPQSQKSLNRNQVRLFVVSRGKSAEFDKYLIRKEIVKNPNSDIRQKTVEALNEYKKVRANMRSTHCYKCKRNINSVNFSICGKCNWIACQCNACGCGYKYVPKF